VVRLKLSPNSPGGNEKVFENPQKKGNVQPVAAWIYIYIYIYLGNYSYSSTVVDVNGEHVIKY